MVVKFEPPLNGNRQLPPTFKILVNILILCIELSRKFLINLPLSQVVDFVLLIQVFFHPRFYFLNMPNSKQNLDKRLVEKTMQTSRWIAVEKIFFTTKRTHLSAMNAVNAVTFYKNCGSSGEIFFSLHIPEFLRRINCRTRVRISDILNVNYFFFHYFSSHSPQFLHF